MTMDGLAIDASHLARRYGRRWALVDVSFQLPRGQVMTVSGPNGSGKTTLLRILSTAIRADAGRASVAGYDVARQREEIRRQPHCWLTSRICTNRLPHAKTSTSLRAFVEDSRPRLSLKESAWLTAQTTLSRPSPQACASGFHSRAYFCRNRRLLSSTNRTDSSILKDSRW